MTPNKRTADIVALLLAVAPLVAAAPVVSAVAGLGDDVGGYASTHLVIRTRPGVLTAAGEGRTVATLTVPALRAADGAATTQAGRVLTARLQAWGVSAIGPVFEGFAHPHRARQLGLDRYYYVVTPPGTDTLAMAADLRRFEDLIEFVQCDGIGATATIPNDPNFDLQWGLRNNGDNGLAGADINIIPGWDITTGDPDLVLAVLDAGLDQHAELVTRLIPGRNVAASPDNDDTSDVCISHGTHVAGIAAAGTDNALGMAGVDWQCRIIPVRVLNSCSGFESHVAEGIVWATDHGADVINISLQFSGGSAVFQDAVRYAHGLDIVIVAASGNSGAASVSFPARWPETISVGAITPSGDRWASSNAGPNLDLMAPGDAVLSLRDTTQYQYLSGTSMAVAHVSGVALLMKAIDPGLAPDDVRQTLRNTAVDMGPAGFDEATGHGLVDAHAALIEIGGILGDLDGDGIVAIVDFLALLDAWGPCPADGTRCPADLDGDGAVGITDLLVLLANWAPA